MCAAVPKLGAPLWLKGGRSVWRALCPHWMCKHARRYTWGYSHQFAAWTSHCTWRWYSISSAGFRHIAPSSPAACQTTVTLESHNPVEEGHEEQWSMFYFKEAELAWFFFGCSGGSWQKRADFFSASLLKREKTITHHYVKRITSEHCTSLHSFCHSSTNVSPAQFLPTSSIFLIIPPFISSTSFILNDE